MNGRPGFSPAIPPSQICCKSNRGLELPKYHLLVLVPGRQARNLGALCTERQWVASELQVLEEEDEDKNAGGKRVSVLAIATLEGEDSNQPAESTALVASMPL